MRRGEKVAIIGNGSMGTALVHAAATAGNTVAIWCDRGRPAAVAERFRSRPLPATVEASDDLGEVIRDAALIVVAVPSGSQRDAARALGALGVDGRPLLSATKGFELGTLARMSEVLAEETGASAVGVIAGANITPEVVAGRLTAIVVAASSARARSLARRCLASEHLRVRVHDDLLSIEVAAALKNVVAIGVSIATGLELGFNARSIAFACGLEEIAKLGLALGADASAFFGLAGAGDLFLTSSSPDSLNRRLGIELGRGARLADVVAALPEVPEGIGSVRACRALARRHGLRLPVAEAVAAILEGEREAASFEAACRDASSA